MRIPKTIQIRLRKIRKTLTGATFITIIGQISDMFGIAGVSSMWVALALLFLTSAIVALSVLLLRPEREISFSKIATLTAVAIGSIVLGRLIIQNQPKPAAEYTGILTPLSLQQGKFPTLEIGDSCTRLTFTGPTGEPLLKMLTDSSLTIELIEGQVKVSTTIRDSSGKVVATLIRNEWQVAPYPGSWDLNYTADALEVKDARGMIVLQVRVLSDRIQLQGEWWNDAGQGWRLVKSSDRRIGTGGLMIPLGRVPDSIPRLNPIEPIFNYPSKTHLGEINISHIFPRKCNVSTQNK